MGIFHETTDTWQQEADFYLKWSERKEHTWRYQRQMSKSKSHLKINVIYMKRENE